MILIYVDAPGMETKPTRVSRVPCVGEHIAFSTQAYRVERVLHYAYDRRLRETEEQGVALVTCSKVKRKK